MDDIDLWQWSRLLAMGTWPEGVVGGILLNIGLATSSLVFGLAIAVIITIARLREGLINNIFGALVEIVRGVPVILLVFWAYFLFPIWFQDKVSPFFIVVSSLTVYASVYLSEILRSAMRSVPAGEIEAALTSGMTRWQTIAHVMVPQSMRRAIPMSFSFFVTLVKDTSVVYVVGMIDLVQSGLILAERRPHLILESYASMALGFVLVCGFVTAMGKLFEKRLAFSVA